MTESEIRNRWRERDRRYALRRRSEAIGPNEIAIIRHWRMREAVRLATRREAQSWFPPIPDWML